MLMTNWVALVAGAAALAMGQVADLPRGEAIAQAAMDRTQVEVIYDPSYVGLDYPGGDVPNGRGVCADVVIRSLRAVGLDLQVLVHEDMKRAFDAYPTRWGLRRPDPNIDHRRVRNLEVFFRRAGWEVTEGAPQPGDIIAWNLRGASGGELAHIGVVSSRRAPSGRYLIVHNIGAGTKAEDILTAWPQTGHYRVMAP